MDALDPTSAACFMVDDDLLNFSLEDDEDDEKSTTTSKNNPTSYSSQSSNNPLVDNLLPLNHPVSYSKFLMNFVFFFGILIDFLGFFMWVFV